MRKCRTNLPNRCYHLISCVAHRAFFLAADERTRLAELIRRAAAFSGVKLLAYSVMSNHFHLFVYIGRPEALSDAEIVRRISALCTDVRFEQVMKKWNELAKSPGSPEFRRYRRSFLRRMWNAGEFMKTLKQHYTMSYNGRRNHHGTMWETRYRVRVRDPGECGMMLAESGYVDANPVNAGMADWPDGYEWCSYAAACRGDETARSSYDFVYGGKGRPWSELKELHDISIRATGTDPCDMVDVIRSGELWYNVRHEEAARKQAQKSVSPDRPDSPQGVLPGCRRAGGWEGQARMPLT